MDTPDSPFRLLAKNYANELLTRNQYVMIRGQLLKKLQSKGNIDRADLNNFTQISQGSINTVVRSSPSGVWTSFF